MNITRAFAAFACGLVCTVAAGSVATMAQGARRQPAAGSAASAMSPMQLLQSGRASQALPHFKQMAQAQPRDMSIQYYLGVAASGARDYGLAELAMSKVIVGSNSSSPFVANARTLLSQLPHKYYPTCAIQNEKTHRWSTAACPIKIYISDGYNVPGTAGGVMAQSEYSSIVSLVQSNSSRLARTPSYKSEYRQYVREGLRAWDWAVSSKLLSYTFVNDPRKADIIVLFCEMCKGGESGFALFPWVYKQPELMWMACAEAAHKDPEQNRKSMIRTMAHEFGHCWGLQHSTVASDLMHPMATEENSSKSVSELCTPNDKSTLTALYSMPGDINYVSIE